VQPAEREAGDAGALRATVPPVEVETGRDVDGAVQSLAGGAIPGLWASGRVTSGIHGDGYISGTSLGDGTFFGRRAGRSAARADT
jgi:predicted oxidoreductase